jgi:hypothetical protein
MFRTAMLYLGVLALLVGDAIAMGRQLQELEHSHRSDSQGDDA